MIKKVKVGIVGGVGNQLFQYYAGAYLSILNSCDLSLDFSNLYQFGTKHESSLEYVNLPIEYERVNSQSNLGNNQIWRLHQKITRENMVLSRISTKFLKIYQSNEIGYDPKIDLLKAPVHIRGYYQTWKYFDFVSKYCKNVPKLKSESNWFKEMSERLQKENFIGIHVRRGDYLNLQENFGILGIDYYKKAIDFLGFNRDASKVIVFSDDIDLARNLFKNDSFHFIKQPKESNSVESIFLMSKLSKLVIANSSFSWWAAKLGDQNKQVVTPKTWFKIGNQPRDLTPENWIKVESQWDYFK